jgi:HAMP domain-containing protein
MKIKLKIRQKILLYILSVFTIFYLITIGYIVVSSRNTILKETKGKAQLVARNSAGEITRFFEKNLTITRTLSQALSIYQSLPPQQWQKLFLDMYLPVIKANNQVYIIWDSWEYYGYIPDYAKDHGRILMYILRDGDQFVQSREERSIDGDPDKYGGFKKGNVDNIWEPYLDVVQNETREARLMTTIASPIQINRRFMGMIGLDVELTYLQELVKNLKPVEGAFAILVSKTGIIAGHPNSSLVNKNIAEVFPIEFESENILSRIQKGDEFSFIMDDETRQRNIVFFSPIEIKGVPSTWSLVLSIPQNQIMADANRTLYISLGVGLLGLIIISLILIFISDNLTKPLVRITESLKRMAKGEISSKLIQKIDSGDEVEEMANALNTTIEGLNHKTSFALDIGNGRLTSKLDLLSDTDILGKSLLDMRSSLKQAKEDEDKRKIEDKKRAWANEGFALFSDILRQNSDSIDKLADEIIRNLVKYLNANQAGMFILNDDDKNDHFFQLMSAYAWDRKKFTNKRVELGEGLVGACAMEQETIQLNEIPDDYVLITSGLGKATPRYVVLVPLKHEETVLGVLEMASFKKMEQYEVDFLEKIAQSIASSILSVRINAKTRYLLEQSQQQAEEMLAQEEEMRQNMEELQATQEEMGRKADEQKQKEEELKWAYEEEIEMLKQQIEELRAKS